MKRGLLARLAILLAPAALFMGCSSGGPTSFEVAPGEYARAFKAAKDVLRDARFDLERVDGTAGVITTTAKPTSGLGTPWDGDQSTLEDEASDFFNHHRRSVRVEFLNPQSAEAPVDLAAATGPLTLSVRVMLHRVERSGLRLDTTSIGLATRELDPALNRQSLYPEYVVTVGTDNGLAARLAERIRARTQELGAESSSPANPPASSPPAASAESSDAPPR